MSDRTLDDTIRLFPICGPCAAAQGSECHTPGCALFLHDAPDHPLHAEMGQPHLPEMAEQLVRLSKWIDGSYPPDLDPEAWMRRRVGKVCEESGEVSTELGLYWGENPRKPRTTSTDPMLKELLDTASAALGGVEYLTGNRGMAFGMLAAHIASVYERAGLTVEEDR